MKKTLIYNMLLDLRKKEIDPFERAKLIGQFLMANNMSQRRLAQELGVPKSTIEDWLLWNRITKNEYNQMIDHGANKTEVYRTLRNNKKKPKEALLQRKRMDFDIQRAIKTFRFYLKHYDQKWTSHYTSTELMELINILNRILIKLENGN